MTKPRVLNEGPRPKHAQLRDALAELAATELGPDAAMPSERELMATYDVSRATVRKAIDGLVADGLLHPDPRQGHLRRPAPAGEPAAPRVVQPGHAPPRPDAVHPAARRRAGPTARRRRRGARLDADAQAWRIDRVRLADGQPIALENGWYPQPLLPGLDRHDLGGSLYELFRDVLGLTIDAAEQTLWGESADARIADAARRPRRTPRSWSSAGSRPPPAAARVRRVPLPRRPLPDPHVSWAVTTSARAPEGYTNGRKHAVSTADAAARRGHEGAGRFNLAPVQKFGRSLMLPIAALPAAALLLRLGQADLLGADGLGWEKVAAVVGAAGNALFANLPLLFAVGIAIGMAKKADGSTALAAVVGYLVFKAVGDAMSPYVLGTPGEGDAGADQLRRARRHRDGPDRRRSSGSATTGSSCRSTSRSSADGASSRSSPRWSRS